jgi:hypothetical protein
VRRGAIVELVPDAPPVPPPYRGRMMSPEQVAAEKFNGLRNAQWVRRNLPTIRLGHRTVVLFELDVDEWIEARRKESVA